MITETHLIISSSAICRFFSEYATFIGYRSWSALNSNVKGGFQQSFQCQIRLSVSISSINRRRIILSLECCWQIFTIGKHGHTQMKIFSIWSKNFEVYRSTKLFVSRDYPFNDIVATIISWPLFTWAMRMRRDSSKTFSGDQWGLIDARLSAMKLCSLIGNERFQVFASNKALWKKMADDKTHVSEYKCIYDHFPWRNCF